ncbi:MAG: TusE/DsrC/DsvC family sulfur relay protein [Gammaproteobacteria bacterium]|nr:TusE/DsrC/DsvC family sulfur relay protein [Caldilineaceae bacterium]MCB1773378.1 TusE/DsrC/DsvC family sulfur relay protein [Gammaproteobacteria bacterium]
MAVTLVKVIPGTGSASLPLDEAGFLLDRRVWNPEIAQQLATRAGLGQLNHTQWMIIDFVRDKYFRLGALPPMRNLCRKLGVSRDAVKASFGGCRELWQIAGLPHPGEEALAYMG